MIPALGMVILLQNLSTGNGQVPGWSCILSVDTEYGLKYRFSYFTIRDFPPSDRLVQLVARVVVERLLSEPVSPRLTGCCQN